MRNNVSQNLIRLMIENLQHVVGRQLVQLDGEATWRLGNLSTPMTPNAANVDRR